MGEKKKKKQKSKPKVKPNVKASNLHERMKGYYVSITTASCDDS